MSEDARVRRAFAPIAATICLSLATPLPSPIESVAQANENINLISNFDIHQGYTDIWGFEKDGVYLAIVCLQEGTAFVNVTDPANPQELLFYPGPVSIWRDAKTYRDYCYIVTDAGGAGLQIVNLSNPLLPLPEPGFTAAFATAHNIFIDEDAGVLYACGADFNFGVSDCTDMLDLSQSPTTPSIMGCFDDFYIHDIYVRDGIAYAAAVYDGFMATLDVSLAPLLQELDRVGTSEGWSHNTWLTADGQYCLTSDETSQGHLDVYDVSDPRNMFRVAEWTNPEEPNSSIHNVIVNGHYAYCSWYTAGLQVIDVLDPENPVRAGFYDTRSGSSGFSGAWGVYPFASNGLIYVSDMQTGLYVFELDSPVAVGGAESAPITGITAAPNPFVGSAEIAFELAHPAHATVDVFDAGGRHVRRLARGAYARGRHEVSWDGRDGSGLSVAPGVYVGRVSTPSTTVNTKIVRSE